MKHACMYIHTCIPRIGTPTPHTYNKKTLGIRNETLNQDMAKYLLIAVLLYSCKVYYSLAPDYQETY